VRFWRVLGGFLGYLTRCFKPAVLCLTEVGVWWLACWRSAVRSYSSMTTTVFSMKWSHCVFLISMFMSLASDEDMANNFLNTCFRFAVILLLSSSQRPYVLMLMSIFSMQDHW